ncbi:TPA: hypothetical protein ACH3X3_001400 [Trebouxia sp. C0006]
MVIVVRNRLVQSRPVAAHNVTLFCETSHPHRHNQPGTFGSRQVDLPRRLRTCASRTSVARASASPDQQTSEQHVSAQPEHLEVGVVLTTHGVKGELKVQALTDFPEERLLTPGKRWLQTGNAGPVKECYLEGGRGMVSKGREIWIIKLRGVDSLTESETLRGQTLLVSSTDRPELEDEDEFLVQDLIDSAVFLDKEDTRIGTVIDVFDGTGKLYFHHRDHNLAHKGTVAVTSLVATSVSTSAFEPFAFL